MNKNLKIGVFDSGIGGVTVLKEIIKVLPNEDYIYYSDSKNNPYGDKTDFEIKQFCKEIVDFLIKKGCKIIVIACNTASAKAAEFLREKYKDIDIIAIEPAYKMIHDYSENHNTIVMATKGTIESEKFQKLYNKYNNNKTELLPCSGLADIIEKNEIEKIKKYLQENLGKYQGKVKNVVLGCTHYPLIKKEISEVIGEVQFFDGARSLAKHLKDVLNEKELLNDNGSGEIEFIDSSNNPNKEKRFWEIVDNMIDFENAKNEFDKYLEKYDKNSGEVNLKKVHTYEVVKLSEYIAKELNLDDEDIEIAKLIGLLHDIGRFEQITTTGSWMDSEKMNHAEYGVKILFENGMIRKFIKTDKYDNIIYKAIINHNKLDIEKGLNEKELLHTKIIRDADKLDNFRVKEMEELKNIFPFNPETIDYEEISEKVYNDFMNRKCIVKKDRKTQIDFWISYIAFIFDLNFNISLKYIYDNNYIDKVINRIEYKNVETNKKMEEIRKFSKEYIKNKI